MACTIAVLAYPTNGSTRSLVLFFNLLAELGLMWPHQPQPSHQLGSAMHHEFANSGAGNASAAINKHIHYLRGTDVRLAFHSFRHTVQSKAMAATNMPNKFPAYIGGWNNGDAKGLQAEYQKGGIPIKVLHDALQTIHAVEDWGRDRANLHQDEWT